MQSIRMFFLSFLVVVAGVAGFAFAQSGGGEVISLTLINADTDQPIGELTDGMVLDFGALGTNNLSVVAITNPATVGSVRFSLDARENYQTESNAPYAIAGDEAGPDYNPWTPAVGEHTLTVTPYSEAGGNGEAGTALTVRFNVVDAATAEAQTEPAPTEPVTPEPVTPEPITPEVTPTETTPAETVPTETTPTGTTPTETAPVEATPEAPATEAQTDEAQTDTTQAAQPTPLVITTLQNVQRTRYQVLPVDGSGVRGSVLVSDYGFEGAVVVILLSGTPVDGVHPAHFHAGDCGSGGDIIVPLENVSGRSGLSVTTTDASYDDIVSGNHYLNIHLSPDSMGTIVACGEVGANAQ